MIRQAFFIPIICARNRPFPPLQAATIKLTHYPKTLWSFGLPKKQYRHCLGNFDLSPNYRGSGTGVNIIANRCTLFDRLLTDPKRQNKKCQNEYCYIWNEISTHGESSVRAGNSQRQSHEGPPPLAASFICRRAAAGVYQRYWPFPSPLRLMVPFDLAQWPLLVLIEPSGS
jgi:hypothetical protein